VAKAKNRQVSSSPSAPNAAAANAGSPQTAPVFNTPGMPLTDKIAWVCLHALILLVPIAMTNLTFSAIFPNGGLFGGLPLTYDQFDIAKVFVMRMFTLIAIGAWGWGMLTRGGKMRLDKRLWLVVAFIAWVSISTMLSIHPPTALFGKYRRFEGLISFVNYALVLFLAIQYADRPSRVRSLARTLVIAGGVVAFYGVLQFAGLDFIKWGNLPFEARRAFASYGNPDLLGGFLMFPLPLSLALALSEKSARWRYAYLAIFFVIIWCWIVEYVRGAWIGGVVGLLLLGLAVWLSRPKLSKSDKWFLVAALVLVLVLGVISAQSSNEVTNLPKRIATIFQFQSGSGETRTQIWQAAIAAIKDRPIFGFGADTFRLVFPKYKPAAYVAAAGYLSVADNVHDYPLQLASGIGIPGALLAYVLFIWTLVVSARGAFVRGEGSERFAYTGFWIATVSYLVHLLFGLSVTGASVFLWLSLGVLLAPLARPQEFRAPSWGTVPAILLVALVALALVGNVIYVVADHYYLRGRIVDSGQERIDDIQLAISLNPYNDMYRAELGPAYQALSFAYLNQAQQYLQAGQNAQAQQSFQAARQEFSNAEQAMMDTIRFVPEEYDNYVFLAGLYLAGGQYIDKSYYPRALEVAQSGVRVEPFGPAIRDIQAQAYQGLGQYDKALAQLRRAIELDPNYADPYIVQAEILTAQGRLQAAKESYTQALQRPLDPSRAQQVKQELDAVVASITAGAKK